MAEREGDVDSALLLFASFSRLLLTASFSAGCACRPLASFCRCYRPDAGFLSAMSLEMTLAQVSSSESRSGFEEGTRQTRLTDDARKCSGLEFLVVGHRNGHCRVIRPALHHDVTSALSNFGEPRSLQNPADLAA